MRVSRSGYYAWRKRDKSLRQEERERLIPIVREAHRLSKGTYGTRRIAKELEDRGDVFIILSNGSETKVGTLSSAWEHFNGWKKVASEEEQGVISLETVIRGTCSPGRFLNIVENFMVFMEAQGGVIKLVAKNHQFLGVSNAIEALADIRNRAGRLGVFWHTQGSGKSLSMVFFSQKVLRKIPGNWTFVIVTDRRELDDQIYRTFTSCGTITEGHCQVESSADLRRLLTEDHRFVFTLIHKFRTENGEAHPVLSERDDIIVITDEAHRSQYDTLALNMRKALPNASFLAFTGTPLIIGEEKTREVFGEYISVYNFRQSIEDGATVPLFYENRIPELQLKDEDVFRQGGDGTHSRRGGTGRGPGKETGTRILTGIPSHHP